MSKIYLSGPMTGLPELNFPLFNAEAARLRGLGFDVVNPAELNPDGASWGDCMRKDIVALMSCGIVATLPDWENSKGAQLEVLIGERLEMAVVKAQDLVRPPAILPTGQQRRYDERIRAQQVQPPTHAINLPEQKSRQEVINNTHYSQGWNDCIYATAKLNGIEP